MENNKFQFNKNKMTKWLQFIMKAIAQKPRKM